MSRFDFRTIVERLPLVVYVDELDERSSPLYVSPQIHRLLGYTQEEWLADPQLFLNSIHPDDRAGVLADIAARNREGRAASESDYRLIARDGTVVWVRADEIVIGDAAHGYLQDVTTHKRDRIRLELLVGILSLAADETPPNEIVAQAAGKLAQIFGGNVDVTYAERRKEGGFRIQYSTDSGKPEFWDVVDWSAAYIERLEQGAPIVVEDVAGAAWLDPIRDRLEERSVASFVDVPLLRHGQLSGVLWFNSSKPRTWGEPEVSVLVDVAEQLAVVLANARAREQRSRDERDLRRRDAILEAVSRSAERVVAEADWRNVALPLLQALGEATSASRAYLFQTHRDPDGRWRANQRFEWVEEGVIAELANPVMQDMCFEEVGLARFAELSERNDIYSANVRELPAEERSLFESQEIRSLMTVPIFVHGEWWGFIGFDDCVSEREWSAETDALRTAGSLLAAAIEREHAAIVLREHEEKFRAIEAELLNAQKLESLGRLAGGVAHDFNNLLTGIAGYASLLLERANGDAGLARDLAEIKRAADRATELTQQLLAFGRRQMFRPRPLDLSAVLTDVAALLQRLVGDDVELEVNAARGLGIVRADPGQIEQVIVNLVVNARDALPAGGLVTVETRDTDDGCVELIVRDNGVGMDEATRSQVFEPFFTTREQGVGLGLASVYGIVHQSGGTVTVQSAPGEGAVFTVRLPRVQEAPEAPAAPAFAEPRPGSETVLLVEDEDIVRDLARRVLERSGYTVLACADGATALEVAGSHDGPIDLLLTDVVMPGLRGYEVAAKVVETRPEIKVLYMSGYAEEAFVGSAHVTDGTMIEKPFAIETLTRRVREELER